MSSKDNASPWLSSNQMTIASPLEVWPQSPSAICALNLIALILHRSWADSHHFREFMCAITTGMIFHHCENTQHTGWDLVSEPALLCFSSIILYTYVRLFIYIQSLLLNLSSNITLYVLSIKYFLSHEQFGHFVSSESILSGENTQCVSDFYFEKFSLNTVLFMNINNQPGLILEFLFM